MLHSLDTSSYSYAIYRQYLFLYLDQSEINEIDILNIKGVHKEDAKFDAMVS